MERRTPAKKMVDNQTGKGKPTGSRRRRQKVRAKKPADVRRRFSRYRPTAVRNKSVDTTKEATRSGTTINDIFGRTSVLPIQEARSAVVDVHDPLPSERHLKIKDDLK